MKHLKKFKLFEGLAIGGLLVDGNPLIPFKDDIQTIVNNIAEDVCGLHCGISPGRSSEVDRLNIYLYRDVNAMNFTLPDINSEKLCTDQEIVEVGRNLVDRFKELGIERVHYGIALLAEYNPAINNIGLMKYNPSPKVTVVNTETKFEDYESELERARINYHYRKAQNGLDMYKSISISHIKILLN